VLTELKNCEDDIKPFLFEHYHKEAVHHLFKVVAGLDSMILGEYQIVAQVKAAYAEAETRGAIGKKFHRLFNKALESSKLVRLKTPFNQGAYSVSYAAVEKCYEQFSNLADRNILIIGAGDTGELVLKNFVKKGCRNICITNRTEEKALALANDCNGRVLPFENMLEGIHEAEIIVTSVSGKDPILDAEMVRAHLNGHERVVMIDLGVPRNIDADVANIEAVTLLNVDDLEEVVAMNAERKLEYVSVAEDIVAEKVEEFTLWLNEQNLAPAIKNIDKAISELYKKELAAYKKSFSEDEFEQVQKFNRYVSKKLKNQLVRQLKSVTDNGRITEFVGIINLLFDENNNEPTHH
jgi:glutamyl-tRNA reductase